MQKNTLQKNKYKNTSKKWPFNISNEPVFSIKQCVKTVANFFPLITISKLRFLEEKNLISPKRASNGYRKYSLKEIERIKLILTLQNERFLPLNIIEKRLNQLDNNQIEISSLLSNYKYFGNLNNTDILVSKNITIDILSELSGVFVENIHDILIIIGKNMHDVRQNPNLYIPLFKKWHNFELNGLTIVHFKQIYKNIHNIKNILNQTNTSKNKNLLDIDNNFSEFINYIAPLA